MAWDVLSRDVLSYIHHCWLDLCDFLGDPDQYCLETLNFCDFSWGGGRSRPSAPSGSAHYNQCSVLKVLCQTCGNIGDIMSKKYAEEKSKRTRFCIY